MNTELLSIVCIKLEELIAVSILIILETTTSLVVAIAIVMAIRIMGIVLLLSLFTIPAVAANSLTKSYASISFWAAIIATFSAVVGLVASYNWEIPPGTSIIFTLTIVLFAAKLYIFAKQKLTLDA